MKKKIVKISLLVFMGVFMFTGGVVAAKLSAKDIGFTSTHEGWNVDNVEDAMNDIYGVASTSKGKIHDLGDGRSFDISDIVGKENIGKYTVDNFIVGYSTPNYTLQGVDVTGGKNAFGNWLHNYVTESGKFVKSYDKDTGIITITGGTAIWKIELWNFAAIETFTRTLTYTPHVYFIENSEIATD